MTSELPSCIMLRVPWRFAGAPFDSLDVFNAAVRTHGLRVTKVDRWQPEERVLPTRRIAVRYDYWEYDKNVETTVTLETDNPQGFTAGELLFKLHNAVVANLDDMDHQFFEGLDGGSMEADGPPLYTLNLGS